MVIMDIAMRDQRTGRRLHADCSRRAVHLRCFVEVLGSCLKRLADRQQSKPETLLSTTLTFVPDCLPHGLNLHGVSKLSLKPRIGLIRRSTVEANVGKIEGGAACSNSRPQPGAKTFGGLEGVGA